MKKVFSLMLLLATICIALPSCSDDDDPDAGVKENIVGTWEGTAAKIDGKWIDITRYPYSSRLGFSATFRKDGTYYGKGAFGTGSGTYTIKGKTIETYVDGELYLKYKVNEMTSSTAELTIIEDDDTLDVRVMKTK